MAGFSVVKRGLDAARDGTGLPSTVVKVSASGGRSSVATTPSGFGLRDLRSIIDYGAKVDGLTDDTAAINAAITDASAVGVAKGDFCELYLPSGITAANNLVISGQFVRLVGPGSIRANAPGDLLTVNAGLCEIVGPQLDGNNIAGNALTLKTSFDFKLLRARIKNVNTGFYAIQCVYGQQTRRIIAYTTMGWNAGLPTRGLIAFEGVGSRTVADCTTTNGSPVIGSATAAFTSADIGKGVTINGYGSGIITDGTTILSVGSGTQVTLSNNVVGTLTGQTLVIGTSANGDTDLIGNWCGGADLADFSGCATVMCTANNTRNVYFNADSKKVGLIGNRLATGGADTTVLGVNHSIVGNIHAAKFIVDSTCKNSIVGPNLTVTQSVNNSSQVSMISAFAGNTLPEYSHNRGLPGYFTPQAEALPTHSQNNFVAIANLAFINRLVTSEPLDATKIAFYVVTGATNNDSIDVGIYDSSGSLLGSSGSTAGLVNSSGLKVVSLTGTVHLLPGVVYYAAFCYGTVGGTAASLNGMQVAANGILVWMGTGSNLLFGSVATGGLPLTGPIVLAQGAQAVTPILAVRSV